MVYSLTYRRPVSSKASISAGGVNSGSVGSIESDSSGSVPRGIPDALSFNRIIESGTCPVSLLHHTQPLRQLC